MKLIIAGGRDWVNYDATVMYLESILIDPVTEVVSGSARGADKLGERWARENNIPIKRFLPNWNKYGKAAGPIRNREMAEYADLIALFPGGRGTDSMYNEALKAGIQIYRMSNRNNAG